MDFLLYLTPEAQNILNLIYTAKYSVAENVGHCKNENFFGYANFNKKFVVCTENIKNSSNSNSNWHCKHSTRSCSSSRSSSK